MAAAYGSTPAGPEYNLWYSVPGPESGKVGVTRGWRSAYPSTTRQAFAS